MFCDNLELALTVETSRSHSLTCWSCPCRLELGPNNEVVQSCTDCLSLVLGKRSRAKEATSGVVERGDSGHFLKRTTEMTTRLPHLLAR